mgnify:CR=1 FL=1
MIDPEQNMKEAFRKLREEQREAILKPHGTNWQEDLPIGDAIDRAEAENQILVGAPTNADSIKEAVSQFTFIQSGSIDFQPVTARQPAEPAKANTYTPKTLNLGGDSVSPSPSVETKMVEQVASTARPPERLSPPEAKASLDHMPSKTEVQSRAVPHAAMLLPQSAPPAPSSANAPGIKGTTTEPLFQGLDAAAKANQKPQQQAPSGPTFPPSPSRDPFQFLRGPVQTMPPQASLREHTVEQPDIAREGDVAVGELDNSTILLMQLLDRMASIMVGMQSSINGIHNVLDRSFGG